MILLMKADLDSSVSLFKVENGYHVVYGSCNEGVKFTDFKQALTEFNSCVMHSAACASLLDEDDEYFQD